jgi:SAM-dependent methyltransferase
MKSKIMIKNNVLCPICSHKSTLIKDLPSSFMKTKLIDHFRVEITDEVDIEDYSLMACMNCKFEFAFPFVEGSSLFYNWITIQSTYYPGIRWEYSKVINIANDTGGAKKLMDIGCGDGNFLNFVKENSNNIDCQGLDTTQISVNKCLTNGHKVFCMNIQEFKLQFKVEYFDFVTAFHVLEHIANPVDFVRELVGLLNKDGAIYISTPYSPMDFELDWFDVLNHPPHHMGRWNLKSYMKVSEILDLNIEVFMPPSLGLIKSSISSFVFSVYGNSFDFNKIDILKSILKSPIKFFSHIIKQFNREKVMGNRASNVILVKLSKKN